MESFENRLKYFVQINECFLLGVGKEYILREQEKQLGFINTCLVYQKMIYKYRRYKNNSYVESLKISDSIIKTRLDKFGIIRNYKIFVLSTKITKRK